MMRAGKHSVSLKASEIGLRNNIKLGKRRSVRRILVTVREPWVRIAPVLKNKKFSNVGCEKTGCEKTGANLVNMFIMPDESCSCCIWTSVVFDRRRSIIHARASFLTFYPEKMSKVE